MAIDLIRSELDERIDKNKDELNTLKSIVKAQKFEIENEILKKTKLQQSEHELKMQDFYRFKADVYSYQDGKYEQLNNTFAKKFQQIFEFMGQTEEKLRTITDLKGENEFRFEDFKNKHSQKLKILEDSVS